MAFYVYLLCSHRQGTFYTGVTGDLIKRVGEHRQKSADGFTKIHGISRLVFYEIHDDIEIAIKREKLIKKWKRDWKYNLIERDNPNWDDLYEELF